MNDEMTVDFLEYLKASELGANIFHLIELVDKAPGNNTYVDIGVLTGKTSRVFLHKALEKNNRVFGIDPLYNIQMEGVITHPAYKFINDDSVEVGRNWSNGQVDIVFVDSIHVKP